MFGLVKKYYKKKWKRYLNKKYTYSMKLRYKRLKKNIQKCGDNVEVFGKELDIFSPQKLVIGNGCKLNDKIYINARSGVEIGNDVTISYGAKLISTGYDVEHWVQSGEKIHVTDKPIFIGDHCWIGAGAIILPGVRITGEYVVIGAGAIVTHDINESRVIVAGIPARIIKKIGDICNE